MSIVLEGTDLSIFSNSDTRNIYQALPIEKTGHTVGNILMMHLSLQTFPSLKRKPEFFVSYRSSTWSADREKKHQMYSTTCSYKNSICHQEVPSSIQDHLVPPLCFFRFRGFQTPPQNFFEGDSKPHFLKSLQIYGRLTEMFYLGMFCSFWDFSGFVSFDFARPSLCQVFFQVFHVLPDYLQMLLDCNVKAPSTQVCGYRSWFQKSFGLKIYPPRFKPWTMHKTHIQNATWLFPLVVPTLKTKCSNCSWLMFLNGSFPCHMQKPQGPNTKRPIEIAVSWLLSWKVVALASLLPAGVPCIWSVVQSSQAAVEKMW